MKRKKIIEKTVSKLNKLSETELKEASDFVDFLMHKVEDRQLTNAIQKQAGRGTSFSFLEEEEELYSTDDLKERYR